MILHPYLYIDGSPVHNNHINRWNPCTGIPVGSRTVHRDDHDNSYKSFLAVH